MDTPRERIENKMKKFLDFMEKECPECFEKMASCCKPSDKNDEESCC